jgi:hypothetical protein
MSEQGTRTIVHEGKVVKGGQNPPNASAERPSAPKGSGGASAPQPAAQTQSRESARTAGSTKG